MTDNPLKKNWSNVTGEYTSPLLKWDESDTDFLYSISKSRNQEGILDPDAWFSKPNGKYHVGVSFHYLPHTFAEGEGVFENRYIYKPSPFLLFSQQDPFNSWGVKARLSDNFSPNIEEYWDWYPGVMIIDTSTHFSLPSRTLANFAGCEWADNDRRISHGFERDQHRNDLIRSSLRVINRVTGPGWSNWPFGERQLSEAVIFWISPDNMIPELLLLASIKQFGNKYAYLDAELYNPGDYLGVWEESVNNWDCRQAIKFLYQAKLLLNDGFPEMALSCAIASLENATAEILLFFLNGDKKTAERELNYSTFLDRFDKVLPKYRATIPSNLFTKLKKAYFARNGIIHGLRPVTYEQAGEYLEAIESVLKWYWLHIGNGNQLSNKYNNRNVGPF